MAKKDFRYYKTFDIHWGDMDAFGHLNSVMFFRYFETARIAYFREIGFENFAEGGACPVIVRLEMNYRLPVIYPSQLEIGIMVTELRNSSFIMECVMYVAGTETLVADGKSIAVWYSQDSGRSLPLPSQLTNLIKGYEL